LQLVVFMERVYRIKCVSCSAEAKTILPLEKFICEDCLAKKKKKHVLK